MGLRNTISAGYQNQELKGFSLYGLHVTFYCGGLDCGCFCGALVRRAAPGMAAESDHGCWCMVACGVNCPVSCEDWLRLKVGQSSQWGTSTGANRLQMKFQMALASADISKVTKIAKLTLDMECLCPQGLSLLVPVSPALVSRLISGSPLICGPCAFQFGVLCCFLGRVFTWVY